jgi:hypothetical protein
MEPSAASELKTLLVGVPLPAEKARLLEYAVQQRAEPALIATLRTLPDREYESLDEVAEALTHVQPQPPPESPPAPHEESGDPPGGEQYAPKPSS